MASAPDRSRRSGGLDRWVYLVIVLVVLGAIGAWAIVAFTGQESEGPEQAATIERINEDPRQFLGIDNVQVSGEVALVEGDAIVLGDDGAPPSEQLLVVPARGTAAPSLEDGAIVQATGEIVAFGRLREDQVAQGLDLGAASLQGFDERPVLVADRLSTDVPEE